MLPATRRMTNTAAKIALKFNVAPT
jgi:hypothetical protein